MLFVDSDRGIGRHPRDLEDAIDVAELYGIPFRSMTAEDLNLNTHAGRAQARRKVAHDSESIADTSRRVARTRKRHTLAGLRTGGPGGSAGNAATWTCARGSGRTWTSPLSPARRDGTGAGRRLGQRRAEIASWAAQVLSGVTLRYIALDLRQRGVLTSHKGTSSWSPQAVREILLHPAIMGKLVYRPRSSHRRPPDRQGQAVHQGRDSRRRPWPPIMSECDYWAVRAVLTDESRRLGPGDPRNGC